MKKTVLSLLLIFILLLTGCANTQQGIVINKDNSVDISYQVLLDNEFIEEKSTEDEKEIVIKDLKSSFEEEGYSFKELEEKSQTGFIVSKRFENLKELSKLKSETFPYTLKVDEKNYFIFKKYNVSLKVAKESVAGRFSGVVEQGLLKNGSYTFYFKTPYKVSTNNANTIEEGNTYLKWDLKESKDNNLEFSYNHYNINNILISSISVILLALILTIIIIRKRR